MSAAPGLVPEIARANKGWGCAGCCPNSKHSFGFHMPPGTLPASDYSLSGALNTPIGDYCCAVDVTTTSTDARRYNAMMFDRWRARKQPPDMAEFIGSIDGTRVWYASWKKPGVVEAYRGQGHDHWTHNSKFRSLAKLDGRWYDPTGPYLGPILHTQEASEEDVLMAVTDAQWKALQADVDRLNKQMDLLADIIGGKGAAYKDSNLATQLGFLGDKIDALKAALPTQK